MAPWRFGVDLSTKTVVGVDEAGRGSLAGPVVAACVVLNNHEPIVGLDDSKKLSEKVREVLYEQIYAQALFVSVKAIDAATIDRVNILQATFLAMRDVVEASLRDHAIDLVLVDGNQAIPGIRAKQMPVVSGDSLVECIMAASIIAKVHRDRLMKQFDNQYPGYGFAQHKGYGTHAHMQAIVERGPSAIHRLSYAPFKTEMQPFLF